MPSRWLRLVIVVFWLATTGWLVWHDIWPDWRPGQPPPFAIDFTDEALKDRRPPINWIVKRQRRDDPDPVKVFKATSSVSFVPDKDEFIFNAEFTTPSFDKLSPYVVAKVFRVDTMDSEYRVDRAGRLHSLRANLTLVLFKKPDKPKADANPNGEKPEVVSPPAPEASQKLSVELWGEVRDGRFFGHVKGGLGEQGSDFHLDLPPANLSYNGSVLMPLHPVNRMHGLRPGQTWRQPLIDPFRDAISLPGFSRGMRYLNARVLPQTHVLEWTNGARADCLVIEYESEGATAGRTWVEQDSGLVQQQEAYLEGDHWTMKRDRHKLPRGTF